MSGGLSETFKNAVIGAGPRRETQEDLKNYLVAEGLSEVYMTREWKSIWAFYLTVVKKQASHGGYRMHSTSIETPPSPPIIEDPYAGSGTRSHTELSASGIYKECFIEILLEHSSNGDNKKGCAFTNDCEKSYISESVVQEFNLPIENGLTRIHWREPSTGYKTKPKVQTTCHIIPEDELPYHDVMFGTGYKTIPSVGSQRTSTETEQQPHYSGHLESSTQSSEGPLFKTGSDGLNPRQVAFLADLNYQQAMKYK